MNLNTLGPLTGTFTISENNYTGNFTLTLSSACTGLAGVAPTTGNSTTTFTVTATGTTVGTCGIRIADDVGQMSNVEVEVAGGTLSVTPATLFFATNTSPAQTVAASDPTATAFTCVSSDPTDVSASITSQVLGSATCTVAPTGTTFTGTAQVTFADSNPLSGAVVQVGVGVQPLSKHTRVTPGGVKRPLPPPPHGQRQPPQLSVQQVILSGPNSRQTITFNVFDYRGALVASSSAPGIVEATVTLGSGPLRLITFVAKAPGSATVRIVDDLGNERYVHVIVLPAPTNRPPGPRGGPP
jgi:putative Mn2+ efflux pump MntP